MPASGDNYYDDGPSAPAPESGGKPEGEEGNEDRPTFIVPKSAFGGREVKPGDKCDFEVCMVHENDVEMYPCEGHEDGEEKEKGPAEATPPAASDSGGMSSMME